MKKQFFSFVMMLALVIVAGTAMAQTKTTPYAGGKYTYTISGLKVISDGTATITPSSASMVVSNIKDQASNTIALNAILTTTTALTFDVTYGAAMVAGAQSITFELTDGAGCKNNIHLNVIVQASPAIAFAISASETAICQNLNASPADNVAASIGATNTITFTVTPDVTNLSSDYTYTYKVNLSGTGLDTYSIVHTSGDGSYSAGTVTGTKTGGADPVADVFTVTFKTTTGIAPVTIPGAITDGSITVTSAGNANYTSSNASQAVNVKTMPSIGTFN